VVAIPVTSASADTTASPPSVSIESPTDFTSFTGDVTVVFDVVTDAAAGRTVQRGVVLTDSGQQRAGTVDCSASGSMSDCVVTVVVHTGGLPNGEQTWAVQGWDSAGAMTAAALHLTLDNPAPQATVTGPAVPASGAFDGNYTLTVDASEPQNSLGATLHGVRFYRGGALLGEDDAAPYSWPITLTSNDVAYAFVWAVAVDSYGDLSAEAPFNGLIDKAPQVVLDEPSRSPLVLPASGAAYLDWTTSVTSKGAWYAQNHRDNYLADLDVLLDGDLRARATAAADASAFTPAGDCQPIQACGPDASFYQAGPLTGGMQIALTPGDAGWRTLTVRAADSLGVHAEYPFQVFVDAGPQIDWLAPADGGVVPSGSIVDIAAAVTARGPTRLMQTDVLVDGKDGYANTLCNDACGTATVQRGAWVVPQLMTGTHTITVQAQSDSGMETAHTITVTVKPSTVLALTAATTTVGAGHTTSITGRLRRVGGQTLAGEQVTLEQRRAGTTTWRTVNRKQTDAIGTVSWQPRIWNTCAYRIVYTGQDPYLASHSSAVHIKVRR